MVKGIRSRKQLTCMVNSGLSAVPTFCSKTKKKSKSIEASLTSEEKDWKNAICSVCLEYPHNAVLLLCSSHDMGCRPYMCGTNSQHSNCLDQFKKIYAKVKALQESSTVTNGAVVSPTWLEGKKSEVMELSCPLCRGQVKGWTVVEPARKCLNKKKRNCMHDGCAFVGSYKELRKHVKSKHRSARACKVDPEHQRKWIALEHERARQDVLSTMPRAIVLGDYVIDMSSSDADSLDNELSHHGSRDRNFLHSILQGSSWFMRLLRNGDRFDDYDELVHSINTSDDAPSGYYTSETEDRLGPTLRYERRFMGLRTRLSRLQSRGRRRR